MIEKYWLVIVKWHWEQSIVSVDSSWGIGRRDGRTGQGQDEPDRTILLQHFSDLRTHFEVNGQINLCGFSPGNMNYFYTSPWVCKRVLEMHRAMNACDSVLARLLAAVAELGVLEGTADKASSSSEGLFPWVKEGVALTYGLVYLHFH
ncbi:hypothetical protein ACJX0J_042303 [Zea mays]